MILYMVTVVDASQMFLISSHDLNHLTDISNKKIIIKYSYYILGSTKELTDIKHV